MEGTTTVMSMPSELGSHCIDIYVIYKGHVHTLLHTYIHVIMHMYMYSTEASSIVG